MLRRQWNKEQEAQILLEYVIVVSVVVLIIFAMNTMIKRGTQGMVKVVADQIGYQSNADQRFDERGHLEKSYSSTRSTISKTRDELVGEIGFIYDDEIISNSKSIINMGFTSEN